MAKMRILFLNILLYGITGSISFGQTLACEKLAKLIEADTTKSIWEYDSIAVNDYYCIGKYFAQKDLKKKIYLIQRYGNAEQVNPFEVCRYKSYGFSFIYHFDIIVESVTKFIEGYNEISVEYLKAKIGDSAYAHINDIPTDYLNPKQVLLNNLGNRHHQKFFRIRRITDTTIKVNLLNDIFFKNYPQFLTKVVYTIKDLNQKTDSIKQGQVLDYKKMKETGFLLTEKSNGNYYFSISFDFKKVAREGKYWWCDQMNEQEYGYIIPLMIKKRKK